MQHHESLLVNETFTNAALNIRAFVSVARGIQYENQIMVMWILPVNWLEIGCYSLKKNTMMEWMNEVWFIASKMFPEMSFDI